MSTNKNIVATFVRILHTFTVTKVGSGSVTKNPDQTEYIPGTPVTFTAVADEGWTFKDWTIEGVVVSENPTVIMA